MNSIVKRLQKDLQDQHRLKEILRQFYKIIRNRIVRGLRCRGIPTRRQQKEKQFDSKPPIRRLGQGISSGDWMDLISGFSARVLFWLRDPQSRNCKLSGPI